MDEIDATLLELAQEISGIAERIKVIAVLAKRLCDLHEEQRLRIASPPPAP